MRHLFQKWRTVCSEETRVPVATSNRKPRFAYGKPSLVHNEISVLVPSGLVTISALSGLQYIIP